MELSDRLIAVSDHKAESVLKVFQRPTFLFISMIILLQEFPHVDRGAKGAVFNIQHNFTYSMTGFKLMILLCHLTEEVSATTMPKITCFFVPSRCLIKLKFNGLFYKVLRVICFFSIFPLWENFIL